MPELNNQPGANNAPAGTGDGNTPPAATPQPNAPAPVTDPAPAPAPDPNTKAVVSQRDKANEQLRQAQEENASLVDRVDFLESYAETAEREKAINNFLTKNAEEYPDVEFDDLAHVRNPDDLEKEAKRIQTRLQQHTQSKILEIEQNPSGPALTPEQVAAQDEELRANPRSGALAAAIRLRTRGRGI